MNWDKIYLFLEEQGGYWVYISNLILTDTGIHF